LYNKNKENSFRQFKYFLTNKVKNDDFKGHWFKMTFKDDDSKHYFLDKATEYIIKNQVTQEQIINNLKSIDLENDYRFSGINYIDIDNIPKKFNDLFELYKWLTIDEANNFLHYFGSNFTKSLLYEIIEKEDTTLYYYNYYKRINKILDECTNDPILMDIILRTYNINIKLNIFLLSNPKYTQFGLLNIIHNYNEINIQDDEYDYNSEWQKIIFNQAINIFFKHYNNLNFNKSSIFDVITYLAYYGFKYNSGNKYLVALNYLLDKFKRFYEQCYYKKEYYFEEVVEELINKQITQMHSNKNFEINDYYLMSWYLEQLHNKTIIENKDFTNLISKLLNEIKVKLSNDFRNALENNFYIKKEYLKLINFQLFYKLSENKNIWLSMINIEQIKANKNEENKFKIINVIKYIFQIYINIFKKTKEEQDLQKYILNLAIEFGIKTKYGIFSSHIDNSLFIEFLEVLNDFNDSLFNKFIEEYFKDINIKEALQLYTYTYIDERKQSIYNKLEPLLNEEHSFMWLPDIEQTIELALYHNFDILAEKLISLYEEYLTKGKDKSGFKYIKCKKKILEIYNKELSQNEKIKELNALNVSKDFDTSYYEEKNRLSNCNSYENFIRALIFYEEEPIKTYQLLESMYEKHKNSLYLFNMISAYFKAYENNEHKFEKYKYILEKYQNDINYILKEDKNLFYFQVLFYGYKQIENYIEIEKLYSLAPKFYKDKLKNELPTTIQLFDKKVYIKNKLLICVEGKNDINFLKNINQNIKEFKDIVDIENQENIDFFDLKGSNLKQFVKENNLKGTNIIELHIYDSDIGSGKNELKYQEECENIKKRKDSSFCFITKKREFENYIHKDIIEEWFDIDMSSIDDWDKEDIPKYIQNKISNNKKEEDIKSILNGKLSKQITRRHLEQLNAFDEIKSWFEKIKELGL
jgi:hypothetical protein